jgi:hypothetical protein
MEKKSNPAALALLKLRWAGTTKEERSAHATMMLEKRWKNHKKVTRQKKVLA